MKDKSESGSDQSKQLRLFPLNPSKEAVGRARRSTLDVLELALANHRQWPMVRSRILNIFGELSREIKREPSHEK